MDGRKKDRTEPAIQVLSRQQRYNQSHAPKLKDEQGIYHDEKERNPQDESSNRESAQIVKQKKTKRVNEETCAHYRKTERKRNKQTEREGERGRQTETERREKRITRHWKKKILKIQEEKRERLRQK